MYTTLGHQVHDRSITDQPAWCGTHLSQPLVCTSTVWSTPLSATDMHIHRVEHTSLSHWYAHPPCGAHLSQPLVCTSTVWSTPLSATDMHIHRVEHTSLNHCTSTAVHVAVCNLDTHSVLFDTEFCLDQK